MNGIINLNKPGGITSAKALYKVRALTGQRKSGHAGALDPAAGGVLILCLGRATKLVERIMDLPKVYRAAARLDVTSESFDSDRPLIPVSVPAPPSDAALRAALPAFQGPIRQIPPAVSALKIRGVPAYRRSRNEATLALKARTVNVYWLRCLAYEFPTLEFEVCCGRGTYVRSIIRDLGERLGAGGCLTSLTRLRVGPFSINDAWTIERIRSAGRSGEYLLDLPSAEELLRVAGVGDIPDARRLPSANPENPPLAAPGIEPGTLGL